MKAQNQDAGASRRAIPAARASGCNSAPFRQTLDAELRRLGGFGVTQLRINPFVSLFAASLITFLPAHALAQTSPQSGYEREEPVSVQDRPRPEFTTEGRRLGTFVLNATLDLSVASTDNLFASPDAAALDDIIYSVAPMAHLESDWSNHMVALEAGGEFRSHEDFSAEDSDSHYLRAQGRFDITRDTSIRGSARTAHQVTPRTDPDSPFVGAPVEYDRMDTSVGVQHRFARGTVSLDANRSDYDYEGAQMDRDNEQTELHGRLEWELSPRIGLLVQAVADERDYQNRPEADSEGRTFLVGAAFHGDLLRGEVSVGRYERDYADPLVGTFEGLAVDAELEWYVTQLTTLTFTANRDADDQISVDDRLPYESIEYGARIDHERRRTIIWTASARLGERDYDPATRHDDYSEAEAGVDWLLNRNAAVRFRYERDEVNSSGLPASRDYEVNKVTVGLSLRL
jgi:hypothetical protein